MWRPLARKALFTTRSAATVISPFVHHSQVSCRETLNRPLPSIVSAFHFSAYLKNPRFFSSNPSEILEDLPPEPPISEANEASEGVDFSAMNVFDESTKWELENEDSILDGSLNGSEEDFQGFVSTDGDLDSVATEDDATGEMKENDPENVEALLSLLQSSDSATVIGSSGFSSQVKGLVFDEDFVLKILETPYVTGENWISFFSWLMKKSDFQVSTRVLDTLVRVVCQENRKRDVYALWDLVKELGEKEKGLISTESLNELIAQFSKLVKGKAAFDVFNKFEDFGCVMTADTYYSTIEVLCKRSFYDWACSVCEKMLEAEKLPDVEKVGKIVSYLCEGGRAKDAHLVYLNAKEKKISIPRSSVNFLITALSRIQKTDKATEKEIDKELDKETVSMALEILNDYSDEDRKSATRSFSSIIQKLCWIEDVERARKLIHEMIESGPPPGNATFNCVINGLSKAGDMEEALKLMKLMESRGLKPDVYTYTVIISGYARGGAMEEACKIFEEAKSKHSKMTPATYHTLIRGYCKLEQFDKAVNLLREMKQHGVHPSHDEYNKLIKSLCLKALDWETAEKLEEEMRADGVILNGRTRALIRAVKELNEEVVHGKLSIPA